MPSISMKKKTSIPSIDGSSNHSFEYSWSSLFFIIFQKYLEDSEENSPEVGMTMSFCYFGVLTCHFLVDRSKNQIQELASKLTSYLSEIELNDIKFYDKRLLIYFNLLVIIQMALFTIYSLLLNPDQIGQLMGAKKITSANSKSFMVRIYPLISDLFDVFHDRHSALLLVTTCHLNEVC